MCPAALSMMRTVFKILTINTTVAPPRYHHLYNQWNATREVQVYKYSAQFISFYILHKQNVHQLRI